MTSLNINKLQVYHLCGERSEWKYIFRLMEKHSLVNTVFYDVLPRPEFNFEMFSQVIRSSHGYVARYEGQHLFAVWFSSFKGATAEIHFCAFPLVKRPQLIELARHVLSEIFELINAEGRTNGFKLNSVYGLIPEFNRKARAFVYDVGFRVAGGIANGVRHEKFTSLDILTITRKEVERWEEVEEV